jgi:Lipocalin-like domain
MPVPRHRRRASYRNQSCQFSQEFISESSAESYVEEPVGGSAPFYPMGQRAAGHHHVHARRLYVGAAHAPRSSPVRVWRLVRGNDEEIKEEALGYIAYSGPFHTDEEKQTLTHSMFVSLFPNWLGQTQPRVVKIEGDMLHLSSATPIRYRWKRNNVLSLVAARRTSV